MGRMSHHAIIVSSCFDEDIEVAHKKASEVFPDVSGIIDSVRNGERSFFVPPDGSKEGWTESHDGDKRRERFIKYLRSVAFNDGSSPVQWVEVQYGDEDNRTMTMRSSDDEYKKAFAAREA